MVKPDPLLFRLLLERYAIRPETAVFIDDNARNVAAANALGLHGVCFNSPAALRDELKAVELLT